MISRMPKNSFEGHCERSEAPIKRPMSRGKRFPKHESLFFFHSANEYSENVILANAEISTGTMSAPSLGLCCTKHPSGSRSREGLSLFGQVGLGYGTSYPVPHSNFSPDPFRLPTDQKIFGSKPCPRGKQSLGCPNFEWLTAWAAKMPISLWRRGWGPNQSPGFTSFARGSPSTPESWFRRAGADPNSFSS